MSTESIPTIESVVEQSLVTLDMGATTTPLPDQFGKDYRALHAWYLDNLGLAVNAAPPITDAKTYDANQKLRTKLVAIRTGLDKTRKAMFEPMRSLKAQVDDYIGTTAESGLQARVKALERVIAEFTQQHDLRLMERARADAERKAGYLDELRLKVRRMELAELHRIIQNDVFIEARDIARNHFNNIAPISYDEFCERLEAKSATA